MVNVAVTYWQLAVYTHLASKAGWVEIHYRKKKIADKYRISDKIEITILFCLDE